jgi:hypothetical protein
MRGIPSELEWELENWAVSVPEESDAMGQVYTDRRVVRLISMIRDATVVNAGMKDR